VQSSALRNALCELLAQPACAFYTGRFLVTSRVGWRSAERAVDAFQHHERQDLLRHIFHRLGRTKPDARMSHPKAGDEFLAEKFDGLSSTSVAQGMKWRLAARRQTSGLRCREIL
jgi:hypothetical protein